jgi:hypothetical protein
VIAATAAAGLTVACAPGVSKFAALAIEGPAVGRAVGQAVDELLGPQPPERNAVSYLLKLKRRAGHRPR